MGKKKKWSWKNIGALWKDDRGYLKGYIDGKPVCVFINKNKNRQKYPDYLVFSPKRPRYLKVVNTDYYQDDNDFPKEDDVPF